MIFFHRTDDAGADAILQDGFRDGSVDEQYADFAHIATGVWFHDHPIDSSRVRGCRVIVFDLDEELVNPFKFENVHPDLAALGWFAPADLLNRQAKRIQNLTLTDASSPNGTVTRQRQLT